MNGQELSNNNKNVVAKHFGGSATEDMMKYMKHPLKLKPDCFIIYAETNDLRSNQNAESMARNIVENANYSKTDARKSINFKYSSTT